MRRLARGAHVCSFFEGGGHQLREMGCIFADHLTGQQARIELVLALGVHHGDVRRVRETVEAGRYEVL